MKIRIFDGNGQFTKAGLELATIWCKVMERFVDKYFTEYDCNDFIYMLMCQTELKCLFKKAGRTFRDDMKKRRKK